MPDESIESVNPKSLWYPPGGLLVWELVMMELLTFGVAVTAFFVSSTMKQEDYEAGAVFWHMCDLIWLLLFPALYLIVLH